MQYNFREFNTSAEVLEASAVLMKSAWGANDFSELPFIRWQYVANPFGTVIGCYASPEPSATEETSAIAAQYVIIPSPLWIPGRSAVTRAALSVNTVTHAQHQGKKLFVQTAERCFRQASELGIEAVFGFPNQSSLPGFLKLGFTTAPQLALRFHLLRPMVLPTQLLSVLGSWRNPHLLADDATDLGNRSFDYQGFAAPEALKQTVHVPRDQAWLAWRYGNHPTRSYRFFPLEGGGLVLRILTLDRLRICLVFDILGQPATPAIKQFLAAARRARIDIVGGVFSQGARSFQPAVRALLPLAVPTRFSPKPFFVIMRALKGTLPSVPHYFTLGDLDLY